MYTEEELFKYDVGGKCYGRKDTLRTHQVVHNEDKLWKKQS